MGITNAIIIGISEYARPQDRLVHASQSARLLADTLRQHCVIDKIDLILDQAASLNGIHNALSGIDKLKKNDALIVAFCGHGKKLGKRWYLVPQDAGLDEKNHRKLIPDYEFFLEYFDRSRVGHVLVILDACYGGIMLKRSGIEYSEHSEDDAVIDTLMPPGKRSRYVITAGAGEVLDGGGANSSIFMEECCSIIGGYNGQVLSARQLTSRIEDRVARRLAYSIAKHTPIAGYLGDTSEQEGLFCLRYAIESPEMRRASVNGVTIQATPFEDVDVRWVCQCCHRGNLYAIWDCFGCKKQWCRDCLDNRPKAKLGNRVCECGYEVGWFNRRTRKQ